MEFSFTGKIRSEGGLELIGVYKILNKVSNKWYVGSTGSSFAKRLRSHRQKLRKGDHSNSHLQNSYNKYGEGSFRFVVSCVPKDKLLEEEQKILDEFWGKPECYNLSKDALAPMRGRKHSPETIKKQQKASKARAKEIGECTRKHRTGSKHSKITIEKMKKSAKNRDDSKRMEVFKSEEYRKKQSDLQKGVPWTQKMRETMSVVQKTGEYRQMMSEATKGIPKSEDWKKKASLARMGKQITLINESGYKEDVISLRNFSEKYDINRHELSRLIKGDREVYKGWKLLGENNVR